MTEVEKTKNVKSFLERVGYQNDEGLESVRRFLKIGVPANSKDRNGFPATHIAMVNHCPKTVLMLIEYGAEINATDKDDATLLHCYIATLLHCYIATLLHCYIATLLHYASAAGYPSIVKYLIDNGCNVNQKAKYGLTPSLMTAGV